MNSASFNQWATVTDAHYRSRMNMQADEFVITLETTDDQYETRVVNGTFSQENPTLALLAYAGAKPSTIDNDFVGSTLPVQRAGTTVQIPQQVFGNGQMILKESVWGPVE